MLLQDSNKILHLQTCSAAVGAETGICRGERGKREQVKGHQKVLQSENLDGNAARAMRDTLMELSSCINGKEKVKLM